MILKQRVKNIYNSLGEMTKKDYKYREPLNDNELEWLKEAARRHRSDLLLYADDPSMLEAYEEWIKNPYNERKASGGTTIQNYKSLSDDELMKLLEK